MQEKAWVDFRQVKEAVSMTMALEPSRASDHWDLGLRQIKASLVEFVSKQGLL
jgi:hypothetical protein